MLCLKCGKSIENGYAFCPECQVQEDARKKAEQVVWAKEYLAQDRREKLSLAIKILIGFIVVIVVIGLISMPSVLEERTLETLSIGSRDLCSAHQSCVVFYVTPWCPACKSAVSPILQMQKYIPENYPDVGVEVVVGLSNKRELAAFASQFGSKTLLDEEGIIYKGAGIKGVPAVFSMNSDGKILGKSGLYRGAPLPTLAKSLMDNLNLK